MTSIDDAAFYYCTGLWKVNVLGSTPPTLGDNVFYLNKNRTFNVRSADYKTADGWADIFNNTGEYQDYDNFQIRVVSTLALPDGVTASAAAGDKVTAYGTEEYGYTDGQFVGTYSPVAWPEENRSILFLGEKNTLYYPQAGAHVNAFRAYFELSNANGVREFVMNFDEESSEATIISPAAEIKEIKERADDAWYTLDGRKLDGKPTKKGMYIYKGSRPQPQRWV